MNPEIKETKIKEIKHKIFNLNHQRKECLRIVKRINKGDYLDAAAIIRYYLNDSGYIWYKPINQIIENQITNLFYDLTYNKTTCKDFFKSQADELSYDINELEKKLLILYETE